MVDHVMSFGEVNLHGQRAELGKGWLKPRAILCARGRRPENDGVVGTEAIMGGGKREFI